MTSWSVFSATMPDRQANNPSAGKDIPNQTQQSRQRSSQSRGEETETARKESGEGQLRVSEETFKLIPIRRIGKLKSPFSARLPMSTAYGRPRMTLFAKYIYTCRPTYKRRHVPSPAPYPRSRIESPTTCPRYVSYPRRKAPYRE